MSDEEKKETAPEVEIPREPAKESEGGTQRVQPAAEIQVLAPGSENQWVGQYPVTDALRSLREVRGQAGAALLYTITGLLETRVKEATEERKAALIEAGKFRDDYYKEKEGRAVLAQKLDSARKIKLLQKVMLTGGGVLVTSGLAYVRGGQTDIGVTLAIVGALLLLGGWLWPTGPEGEES